MCSWPPMAKAPGRSGGGRAVPGRGRAVAPWTFTDAIDAGHTEDALVQLHRLLDGGDRHPLVVLAILHRHVQGLCVWTIRRSRARLKPPPPWGSLRAGAPFRPRRLWRRRRWGSRGVAEAIGLVADAELGLKGASAWPAEAILEVLVARLCRLARTGSGGGGGGGRGGDPAGVAGSRWPRGLRAEGRAPA